MNTFLNGKSALVLASALFAALSMQPSFGALFTLVDNNSIAQFDTASPQNQVNWLVDSVDQLNSEAFWFRVGNVPETSVHTLPIGVQGATDANFDGNLDSLFVRYVGAGFNIEIKYSLSGGTAGSGASDLSEQISIINLTAAPLDFHFFEYADFDITGPGPGNQGVFPNMNTVRQSNGGTHLTETVVTPPASHRELALFPNTLNTLNDGLPTTLSDTPMGTLVAGPDITWAYQWDFILAAGDTFQVSKDKNLGVDPVPEPGVAALMGVAGALVVVMRRRKVA